MPEGLPTPGLKWRKRKAGPPAAYWVANPDIVKRGYSPKTVQIHYDAADPYHMAHISTRCCALTTEMREFSETSSQPPKMRFQGTIASLVDLYISDPESPFFRLKSTTHLPYLHYAKVITATVGARRISECDGRDVRRWFIAWSEGGRMAKANTCISILKSALAYGIMCRHPHCAPLREIISVMRFEKPKARKSAPSIEQIKALRTEAHKRGHGTIALAVSMQFETLQRLWDIAGQWLPMSDPTPSAILAGREKWIGPQWSDIDGMILRWQPTKTAETTGVTIECDLSMCPMTLEEISLIPESERKGPLIRNAKGEPYRRRYFQRLFRAFARKAELPDSLWCRDIRAGGITDARRKGATLEDTSKAAGHSDTATTARVYDRGILDAHRRVAAARTKNTP